MNTTPQASKNDVLYTFSVESNPNSDTLASYLKRSPQYREALIDLSIELFITPKFDEVAADKVSSNKSKQAWSKFQSLLSPTDPASEAPQQMAQGQPQRNGPHHGVPHASQHMQGSNNQAQAQPSPLDPGAFDEDIPF